MAGPDPAAVGAPTPSALQAQAPVLRLQGLSKAFGGERALDGVELTVLPGEVHGLLGENGSGKSTLIKVLAGFHQPEPGATLEVGRVSVELPLPAGGFRGLGLSFVHQDLGLHEELTVLENLLVGELSSSKSWHLSWRSLRARGRETLARHGVDLDLDTVVAALTPTQRALLAIVRAVEGLPAEGGLLVLDEPTVFLPREGVQQLFELIRLTAGRGGSVLFVSHDLDEVREITDRITVLRDGRVVDTVTTPYVDVPRLVELIVGRALVPTTHEVRAVGGRRTAVTVSNLHGGTVRGLSVEIDLGETLGLTGVIGSGFELVPYLLFGAVAADSGTLSVADRVLELPSLRPFAALDAGIGLVPADRQNDGAVGDLTAGENVTLTVLDAHQRGPALRRRELTAVARALLEEFDVRPPDPDRAYHSLSGGNQQKTLLAKWLQARPQLLLLHEPTQGVDIGAREQIYETLRRASAQGTSTIVASSDHEQLARICDRVLITSRGLIAAELTGENLTRERITERTLSASVDTAAAA